MSDHEDDNKSDKSDKSDNRGEIEIVVEKSSSSLLSSDNQSEKKSLSQESIKSSDMSDQILSPRLVNSPVTPVYQKDESSCAMHIPVYDSVLYYNDDIKVSSYTEAKPRSLSPQKILLPLTRQPNSSPKPYNSTLSTKSEKTGISIYNNWTDKNRKTVINWRNDLTQIGFAYDYVISKYRKREKKYSIWLFIISSVITTISLSQFNSSEDENELLSTIFKIGFVLLSFIATLLSGIQKINNYSKLIEEFRTYVNDLENFVTILSSELMLPDNLRKDALDFILLHRATFQKLLSNNPDIDDTDYKEAIDKYLDYIDNIENRKYNRRRNQFRREDSIDIEMVGIGNRGEGQTRPVVHLG